MAAVCLFGLVTIAPLSADDALAAPGEQTMAFGNVRVSRWIVEAVVAAARATRTDPAYLMALADKESSLVPGSRARTSSAEGLFQFLEATWLEVVLRYGAKHGYAEAADAIAQVGGRVVVGDETMRHWILGLRRDPLFSALMAGEMIRTHRESLAGKIAREPSFSELYLAHFLGATGANRLFDLVADRSAPEAFPAAAKANADIFFKTVTSIERRTVVVSPPARAVRPPAIAAKAAGPVLVLHGPAARPKSGGKPVLISVSAPSVPSTRIAQPSASQPTSSVIERAVLRTVPRTITEVKEAFASMIDRRVARYANVAVSVDALASARAPPTCTPSCPASSCWGSASR